MWIFINWWGLQCFVDSRGVLLMMITLTGKPQLRNHNQNQWSVLMKPRKLMLVMKVTASGRRKQALMSITVMKREAAPRRQHHQCSARLRDYHASGPQGLDPASGACATTPLIYSRKHLNKLTYHQGLLLGSLSLAPFLHQGLVQRSIFPRG